MNTSEQKNSNIFIIAITIIILAAMLLGLYVFKRFADAPGQIAKAVPITIEKTAIAVSKTTDLAAEAIKKLAAAINTKTIKREYESTGTQLAGTSRLQVATIDQTEYFNRTDGAATWGISLPDVVVSARAPVEYTYYLDLGGDWDFKIDEKHVYVIAPPILHNKPAVDASAITYKVEQGSIIRNETAAKEALKQTITEECNKRASGNIQIARETARREAERFVRQFIVQSYGVDKDTPVSVVFRDEVPKNTLQARQ